MIICSPQSHVAVIDESWLSFGHV